MKRPQKLVFSEEFFLLLSISEDEEINPVEINVSVDLEDFKFTESELEKLRKLAERLELALLTEFTQHCSIASVVVEVRP